MYQFQDLMALFCGLILPFRISEGFPTCHQASLVNMERSNRVIGHEFYGNFRTAP
jgi:hypothetical protein